jgi:hypothetical protein
MTGPGRIMLSKFGVARQINSDKQSIIQDWQTRPMFQKKTVIVIGAGASREFDLPAGDELKNKISDLLRLASAGTNSDLASGFRANLMRNLGSDGQHKINSLLAKGRILADLLPNLPSFISRVRSVFGPCWGGLQIRSA